MTTDPTPTVRRTAAALLHDETNGLCDLGKACDLCDCGMDLLEPQDIAQRTAGELDRARNALAAVLDVEEMARVLGEHAVAPRIGNHYECMCGAYLANTKAMAVEFLPTHQAEALRAAILGEA